MTGATDIRERKQAEAENHTLAHGERLHALGEMASGIAHDLNQSLALITGYSEIAHQELNQPVPDIARVREMVEITARAALEGGEALRGLLSFVSTQEVKPDAEALDAGAVLQEAARLTAPRWRDASQAEGRPIDLEVEFEPGCALNGSAAALREAITNLIFNAVDALPSGGTIRLTACREGDQVILEVRDSGTGIPRDVQSRVFDPFVTTKGERGTGLGLSQVTAIVKRQGGTIELLSAPAHGTTFRLKFPRAATSARRAQPNPVRAAVSAPKRHIRILVVEDEKQLARMAMVVLTQRGHTVVVAATGEEALEHLEHQRFELIVSDLGLGSGKNGWDLAQAVGARWPETHFVLVTGWGAAIDLKDAQARGVHEVISKPYRIAELRQVADRLAGAGDAKQVV
jgi:nitrogen-specific signal transduction histidine kinase/ActR/RegA family two-component response regulator